MSQTLGQPITFARSGRIAQNRTLKSAMTERLCTWDDANPDECGKPTKEYLQLYTEWAKGQIGITVLGNIPCDRRYPEAKRNAIIDPLNTWDAVAAFRPVIQAAKANGSLVLGQVTHAGRQTSDTITATPVSSSDIQAPPLAGVVTFGKPRPLTGGEIKDIVNRFAHAAKVLYDAGADGIQLHAAHGYLLSQFLSPRVNKRTDEYGGDSLDNRSRIVFEIYDAIKAAIPDKKFILAIKINSADFSDGGFSPEDSQEITKRLEAAGVDIIELSGGTYESFGFEHKKESTKQREAFFIEFAERIRPHLSKAKLCVTGGFRSLAAMSQAIADGATDIVGIARPLTAEPHLIVELLAGTKEVAKPNHVLPLFQTLASYAQIAQISEGKLILDLSDEETARKATGAIAQDAGQAALFRPTL